ncbi:pilus assembly protein TadG-related protein [Leekyejoonella antrihumi]|uniref:Uncharacterized protein n=1 Tax=Leekyejoonella antrihumi TaxID=1660198 RepID=A0A563DYJ2_9MICO|nr:pilus assembly protein TadG-related protein [Leekyejoonella antrihumi]TWP35296.1 hypothetical protein FGL98_14335 [Leekyejoonella antrihumi]
MTRPAAERRARIVRTRHTPGRREEDGRILILTAGLFALLGLLIVGGIDVTSVQIARMHVLDAADAAAVHAADAVDKGSIYRGGIGETVTLSNASVQQSAAESLQSQSRPAHVVGWGLAPSTGTPDGATAVVRVSADVRPPMLGGVLSFIGSDISVTVESHARADID